MFSSYTTFHQNRKWFRSKAPKNTQVWFSFSKDQDTDRPLISSASLGKLWRKGGKG